MFDVSSFGAQDALSSVADWAQYRAPMPSPNVANNKNPAAEGKKVELAPKLARRRSQEFADKIAGWNQAGGGVVQGNDEVVVILEDEVKKARKKQGVKAEKSEELPEGVVVIEDDAEPEAKAVEKKPATPAKPKTPVSGAKAAHDTVKAKKTSKEVDLEKKAWVRRKSKPQNELDEDLKQAVSPKKRVVSDGHWRRDRAAPPPAAAATPEKEPTPKPVTIKRSVVNVGLKIPPAVQNWVEETEPEPVRRRPLRSRSRSHSRDRRDNTPDYEDSGTKIYVKRRPRAKTASGEPRTSKSSDGSIHTATSSLDKTNSTDITTPSSSPTKEAARRISTAPREKVSRRFLPTEDEPIKPSKSPRLPESEPRRASHKRMPTNDEKVRSSPQPESKPSFPPNAPKVFGGRIEGWLATTSDPFTEPALAPKPLSVPRRTSRKALDDISTEYTETDDGHRHSSAQRQRSRPHLEPITIDRTDRRRASARSPRSADGDSDLSGASTPTLQRRGARRTATSPIKRGSSPVSTVETDNITVSTDVSNKPRQSSRTLGHRSQPSTGRRLPTIASADTLTDTRDFAIEGSMLSRASDGDDANRSTSLKRRLTKHSDLISVLSLPRGENKGIKSARSIRTQRTRMDTATIADLMNEVTSDELKYQRELRTLVDGVIPVLLQSVLSRSNTSATVRISQTLGKEESTVTQPIVNMGIALERLKSAHKRIPMHEPNDLVAWAQNTAKVYADYLQAWRMGFQDIVVNLAPAEGAEKQRSASASKGPADHASAGDGERVDVAYLLKRPLVRLKYLAKTFKGIQQISPSPGADGMAVRYKDLVDEARRRANDERARLEDEAAAAIDPTRARDVRSLAPLSGVRIDPTRCVRARDYFDMDLRHSTGQQLTCKIEIIIRDDAPERGTATDLLFCEVSTTGRWLLFPPVLTSMVSVRSSKTADEIVVMIRGLGANGKEWRELMSLQSSDDGAVEEWMDMLPASPVPPSLMKKSSFDMLKNPTMSGALPRTPTSPSSSPRDVQIPIGERATSSAPMWDGSDINSVVGDEDRAPPSLKRAKAKRYRSTPSSPLMRDSSKDLDEDYAWEKKQYRNRPTSMYSSSYNDRPRTAYTRSTTEYTTSTLSADWTTSSGYTTPRKEYSVWMPDSRQNSSDEESPDDDDRPAPRRPSMHRRTSSVPSLGMPTVNKLRKRQQNDQPSRYQDRQVRAESSPMIPVQEPSSAPPKLSKRHITPPKEDRPPQTPAHKPTSVGLRSSILPSFTPNFLKKHRRSSSPLKHEYDPSTASESVSEESDLSDVDDEESVTSESSAEDDQVSTLGPLKGFPTFGGYKPMTQPSPPESAYSPSGPSVAPSNSASQAPYRTVPVYDSKASQTAASIFAWADDAGSWASLHPEECLIIVTPGLIEAFDLAQAAGAPPNASSGADQSPSTRGVKPLIALELTPLVPLRRGTALDISIRSPPTPNSMYKTGANVMFRSASSDECEGLYHLINRARINNPTYIALQNARGPIPQSNWGEAMDARNASRGPSNGSWWNLHSRKGSYRSKGSRRNSIAGGTDSSIGTMNSAFSALRRFSGSGSNRIFNIAKSTISTRESGGGGSRGSMYSDSLDSGAATPVPPLDPRLGTPLGLTNMKIRLYARETASKWRDMGSARLTIMLPPRLDPSVPADPRVTGKEKRILIHGKSQGEMLLDATLGESCFERVARTGIAVSVWEEFVGPNGEVGQVGKVGGVLGARARVYMVQMKSERDTAYTFGLVGKLRY